MNSARSLLCAVAVIAGLVEVGMAFQFALDGNADSAPAPAAAFAAAFLLLAWFARAGNRWPVIALIVLFALEMTFVPMFARESWIDWAEQAAFVAISVVGLIAGISAVARHRHARPHRVSRLTAARRHP
jgi:hypothetical protein